MTDKASPRRALVTGGAGLIRSHLAGPLLAEGYRVRILDNLEPRTHRNGVSSWVPEDAEGGRATTSRRVPETLAHALG